MPDVSKYYVRDFLLSVQKEGMKLYRVYDGTGRLTYQYDAPATAKDGDLCMRTAYGYNGASSVPTKMLETLSNWQAAWDITP